jgi:hypothetical protein
VNDKLARFKSSFSANGQSCVECARLPGGGMAVRDTKDPDGPTLIFTSEDWEAFTRGIRAGELD